MNTITNPPAAGPVAPDLAALRVEHAGSLLRPRTLLDAFSRHGAGDATDDELRAAEDTAIREVIHRQEAHGLPIVNDGEYRRITFGDSFAAAVSGFKAVRNTLQFEQRRATGGRPLDRAHQAVVAPFATSGATFAVHICLGNRPGAERKTGGYEQLGQRLFAELPQQRFLLEFDQGGFGALRHMPRGPGKVAVLGLVSSRDPRVETPDELQRRVDEASRSLPPEQIALTPTCGFAGSIGYDFLPEDTQWQKLDTLVEAAGRI